MVFEKMMPFQKTGFFDSIGAVVTQSNLSPSLNGAKRSSGEPSVNLNFIKANNKSEQARNEKAKCEPSAIGGNKHHHFRCPNHQQKEPSIGTKAPGSPKQRRFSDGLSQLYRLTSSTKKRHQQQDELELELDKLDRVRSVSSGGQQQPRGSELIGCSCCCGADHTKQNNLLKRSGAKYNLADYFNQRSPKINAHHGNSIQQNNQINPFNFVAVRPTATIASGGGAAKRAGTPTGGISNFYKRAKLTRRGVATGENNAKNNNKISTNYFGSNQRLHCWQHQNKNNNRYLFSNLLSSKLGCYQLATRVSHTSSRSLLQVKQGFCRLIKSLN